VRQVVGKNDLNLVVKNPVVEVRCVALKLNNCDENKRVNLPKKPPDNFVIKEDPRRTERL
jgi:hypothetical protein